MKISKRTANRMVAVGFLGFTGVLAYSIHLGIKTLDIANTPPYRAAERIYELGEETAAREDTIDDCLAAHPQEPDTCLNTIINYFDYAEQANAERAQLEESFPGYQAAVEEINNIMEQFSTLTLVILPLSCLMGFGWVAYHNRKSEEAAQQEKAGGLTVDKQ